MFGPPGNVGSTPRVVITQQRALSNFLFKTPRRWFALRHVVTFLQLQEQVHSAWRVIGLERQLGEIPLRQASEPPSGSSYRVIYRKPYSQALDPNYVVSVSVPPHFHAGIVVDELCHRHLRPLTHLTPTQVHHIMGGDHHAHLSTFHWYPFPPCARPYLNGPDNSVS